MDFLAKNIENVNPANSIHTQPDLLPSTYLRLSTGVFLIVKYFSSTCVSVIIHFKWPQLFCFVSSQPWRFIHATDIFCIILPTFSLLSLATAVSSVVSDRHSVDFIICSFKHLNGGPLILWDIHPSPGRCQYVCGSGRLGKGSGLPVIGFQPDQVSKETKTQARLFVSVGQSCHRLPVAFLCVWLCVTAAPWREY